MGIERALTDIEYKVMSVIWQDGGETPAKHIHEVLSKEDGLERASTYQIIHRCIAKGAIERIDPGFICRAKVAQDEMQAEETRKLIDRVFGGSAERLLVALIDPSTTSQDEIDRLRSMVRKSFNHSE